MRSEGIMIEEQLFSSAGQYPFQYQYENNILIFMVFKNDITDTTFDYDHQFLSAFADIFLLHLNIINQLKFKDRIIA